MSQSPSRKLAARRGSVSAPDPLGRNAALNHDPNRSTSSTLSIVRIVDPSGVVPTLSDSPTHGRRSLRRHGTISTSSADNRLSFAFASFSPPQPSTPLSSSGPQNHSSRTGSSPSSSPRLRPSSPQFVRRNSASGGSAFSRPSLTPEQLVDLARQSSAPRYVPGSPSASHFDAAAPLISSPAKFIVLPVDVYLPFIDRAAETTHLLSTPPTTKLFSLLAQTFPAQVPPEETQDPFAVDPARWTFNTLRQWLTEVDRQYANDAVWVRQARKCVLAHSELIWERLKGALGVPPELEVEDSRFIDADTLPDLSIPMDVVVDYPRESLDSEQLLVIEPILATSTSLPTPSTTGIINPPPSSLPAGLSQSASKGQVDLLQDIVEDREDEEEPNADVGDEDRIKSKDDSKAQIHGIRLCTSPVPSTSTVAPLFSYPPSPDIGMNVSGGDSVEPRSPDLSHPPASSSEIGDSESERAYDPVGDRIPGNPLFPSNFARLALGPTLRANNPSLRSSHVTTPRWARWAPGSRPPSWFETWDPVKQEYAATVASGSSIGGGE